MKRIITGAGVILLLSITLGLGVGTVMFLRNIHTEIAINNRPLWGAIAVIALCFLLWLLKRAYVEQELAESYRQVSKTLDRLLRENPPLGKIVQNLIAQKLRGTRTSYSLQELVQLAELALRAQGLGVEKSRLELRMAQLERKWDEEKRQRRVKEAQRLKRVPEMDIISWPKRRIPKEVLQTWARNIEKLLLSHGIEAQVTRIKEGPRVIHFDAVTQDGVRTSTLRGLSEDIGRKLGLPSCRAYPHNGRFRYSIPHPKPENILLRDLLDQIKKREALTLILGLDEDESLVSLKLTDPDVIHILVSGRTGSGKTELLRTMLHSLMFTTPVTELQVGVIDPQGSFRKFSDLPYIDFFVEDATKALGKLRDLLARRQKENQKTPVFTVFIDELAQLVRKNKKLRDVLTILTQSGRHTGIHVVASIQVPESSVIPRKAKINFPVIIAGHAPDSYGAYQISGVPQSGAEKLKGRGNFALIKGGEVTFFQAALSGE